MALDPIVLLAYVSVAINLITLLAAGITYTIFRARRARQHRGRPDGAVATDGADAEPFEPVFLRPVRPGPGQASPFGGTPFAAGRGMTAEADLAP